MRDPNESYNQGFAAGLAQEQPAPHIRQDRDYMEGYIDGLTYETVYPLLD